MRCGYPTGFELCEGTQVCRAFFLRKKRIAFWLTNRVNEKTPLQGEPWREAFWPTRQDSNLRPSESESDALSSWATGSYSVFRLVSIPHFCRKCKSFLTKKGREYKKSRPFTVLFACLCVLFLNLIEIVAVEKLLECNSCPLAKAFYSNDLGAFGSALY